MKEWLALVVYRCTVSGRSSGSLDIQVRYFKASSERAVISRLKRERPCKYANYEGKAVAWKLSRVICVEELRAMRSGEELIGMITQVDELRRWTGAMPSRRGAAKARSTR